MTPEVPGDLQTIDEIITLAELEPSHAIVFTEGRSDARLLRWFLEEIGIDCTVVPINERICIRREEVQRYSADYGERDKNVTFAQRLEESLGAGLCRMVAVVDADWTSEIGPIPIKRDYLLVTDFPSMEHYAIQDRPFRKWLALSVGKEVALSPKGLMEILEPALLAIGALRLAAHHVGLNVQADPYSCVTFRSDKAKIDQDKLVNQCLSNSPRRERAWSAAEFAALVSVYETMLSDWGRNGRGHDLAPLLVKLLGLKGAGANQDVVEGQFRSCLQVDDLSPWPMFQNLVARLSATTP